MCIALANSDTTIYGAPTVCKMILYIILPNP